MMKAFGEKKVAETGVLRRPALRPPMQQTLTHKFNDIAIGSPHLTIIQVLDKVLTYALGGLPMEPNVAEEIQRYQVFIKSAQLGQLIQGFIFTTILPAEILDLLRHISRREHMLVTTGSPLVSDSENQVAANDHSAKVIFEQACRLEQALVDNTLSGVYKDQAATKLTVLLNLLYQKFAELIINAKSVEQLKIDMDNAFNKALCTNLEDSRFVYKQIRKQFRYLKEIGFLPIFYQGTSPLVAVQSNDDDNNIDQEQTQEALVRENHLAQQSAFVTQIYEQLTTSQDLRNGLGNTLLAIIEGIAQKAFQPCETQKHQLMANPDNKVMDVIIGLDDFVEEEWDPYGGTELLEELNALLDATQDNLIDWETFQHTRSEQKTPHTRSVNTTTACLWRILLQVFSPRSENKSSGTRD